MHFDPHPRMCPGDLRASQAAFLFTFGRELGQSLKKKKRESAVVYISSQSCSASLWKAEAVRASGGGGGEVGAPSHSPAYSLSVSLFPFLWWRVTPSPMLFALAIHNA